MISPVPSDSGPPRAARYPTLAEWAGEVSFAPLQVVVEPGWSRFNPSLAAVNGSLRAIIRSSNYRLDGGRYITQDADGSIHTNNYLVDVDERGTATNSRPIVAPSSRTVSDFPVHGYEDVRLAPVGEALWALGTIRDSDESGLCRVALLRLAEDGRVLDERCVDGPVPGRHEKNWVPFENGISNGDAMTVVYSWEPFVVAEITLASGVPDSARFRELSRSVSGLGPSVRGGTNGVRIDDGWLFLVHESRRFPDGRPRYLHRFVVINDDFTVGRVSPILTLMTDGVEFALGAAVVGGDLLIGFGLDDAEAWSARMSLATMVEQLEPLGSTSLPS